MRYAEELGWRVELSNGHAWGRMFCPWASRGGCIISVWSTPRSEDNHARQIRNRVDGCPHRAEVPGAEREEERAP